MCRGVLKKTPGILQEKILQKKKKICITEVTWHYLITISYSFHLANLML